MSLHIWLPKCHCATVIRAYVPMMTYPDEVKKEFYECLSGIIRSVPSKDKLIICSDLNPTVGQDIDIWAKVLGHHDIGKANSIALCVTNKLVIVNTIFQQKHSLKTTCMHPRSHLTWAVCSSTTWSDHCLVKVTSALCTEVHYRTPSNKILCLDINK